MITEEKIEKVIVKKKKNLRVSFAEFAENVTIANNDESSYWKDNYIGKTNGPVPDVFYALGIIHTAKPEHESKVKKSLEKEEENTSFSLKTKLLLACSILYIAYAWKNKSSTSAPTGWMFNNTLKPVANAATNLLKHN